VKVESAAGVKIILLSTGVQRRCGNHIAYFLIRRGAGWFNREGVVIGT
jgi:hypothetical protein